MQLPRPSTLFSLLILLVWPGSAQALNVRILIASAPQLTVRVPVQPGQENPLTPASLPAPAPLQLAGWLVGVTGEGSQASLTLNGQDTGNASLYLPPVPGSVVEIGAKSYRGGVQLRLEKGQVQAINVVELEEYLRGVVPSEMPASWPAAALAAQAVIARTYVAANVNAGAPYDTCATEACQVYAGVGAERGSTDAAIRSTAGQVIAYGMRPAVTYFSSDSGGYTASASEVWGMDLPYLIAKPDPFSVVGGSPKARWRLDVPGATVQAVAAQYGAQVGTLKSVNITRLSASGRPLEITLTGAGGTARITGARAGGFIRSLGAGSSRVTISGLNPLVIQGTGLGHGVGLSQYGALGLANQGYDHLHILGFYYPGTALSRLAGVGVSGAQLASGPQLPATLTSFWARGAGGGTE